MVWREQRSEQDTSCREGAAVPDSDKTQHFSFYLQIECKNKSPRWHLSQTRWPLPAQSLSHTYIFTIHTPIYTHFRTRLCPPKASWDSCTHTHTLVWKQTPGIKVSYFISSQRSYIKPFPIWQCLSQNNVRSSALGMEYAKSWCSFEAWRNLVVCGYFVLFVCSMFDEKYISMACVLDFKSLGAIW